MALKRIKRKKKPDTTIGVHGGMANNAITLVRQLVDRIENLQDERSEINKQIKEVYGEAKAHGIDTKALREVIKRRNQDADERDEFEAIVDTYMAAMAKFVAMESDTEYDDEEE